MEINEPSSLKDAFSGKIIDYSGAANLGSAVGFQKFSAATGLFTIDAAKKFNLLVVGGKETINTNTELYHEFLFEEVSNHYSFKLGIIPKETGIFRL